LTPQGSSDFVQIKLGMILHAPEHAWTMSDLNGLNLGFCVEGQ
jgi:hypothetical protein